MGLLGDTLALLSGRDLLGADSGEGEGFGGGAWAGM